MAVAGEGRSPSREHMLKLASQATIAGREATAIVDQVRGAVARWPEFALQAGVGKGATRRIAQALRGGL
jgi:serine/threonine-protein kinase HipA